MVVAFWAVALPLRPDGKPKPGPHTLTSPLGRSGPTGRGGFSLAPPHLTGLLCAGGPPRPGQGAPALATGVFGWPGHPSREGIGFRGAFREFSVGAGPPGWLLARAALSLKVGNGVLGSGAAPAAGWQTQTWPSHPHIPSWEGWPNGPGWVLASPPHPTGRLLRAAHPFRAAFARATHPACGFFARVTHPGRAGKRPPWRPGLPGGPATPPGRGLVSGAAPGSFRRLWRRGAAGVAFGAGGAIAESW